MPKYKGLNAVYISGRLQECLRPIAGCALTTIIAPMGYGKTTAINWYLNERGRDVTEIGNSARTVFNANAAIRSITFPDTLKEMSGLPLFYGCENLETITIPASVTGMNFHSVADCFIFNCPNLKTIIFKGTRAQWEAIEKEDVNLDGITVRCSDDNVDPVQPDPDQPDPDQPEQPDPGDPDDKDVFLQFEDCSVDVEKPDGTTLHFDALTGVIQSGCQRAQR